MIKISNRNTNLGGTDFFTASTTLNGNITSGDTTITLTDASSFGTTGLVLIDNELIGHSGKTSNNLTGCTRAWGNSVAAAHTSGVSVYEKEVLNSVDLNDTFDAAYELILGLTTFYFNTSLYDVYDDFDSYSTGAFSTNTNWTVSGGTVTVETSTNAGGSNQELKIHADATTSTVSTKELTKDKHTFIRCYAIADGLSNNTISGSASVRFANTGAYFPIFSWGISGVQTGSCTSQVMVINTAAGAYDLYVGGKRVAQYSSVSDANAKILDFSVAASAGGAATQYRTTLYIDDVRQSK